MPQQQTTIPPEVANHVLWQYGRGGYGPGSFTQHLLNAFASADQVNFHRLQTAYPDYGHAVTLAQYDPEGITALQKIAGGAK